MARKGNPISVRLDLNRSSDSSRFRVLVLCFTLIGLVCLVCQVDINLIISSLKSIVLRKSLYFLLSRLGGFGLLAKGLLVLGDGGWCNMMAPSGGSGATWKEDTREIDILLESYSETEDTGSSVNQPVAPPVPPANPVASPGEAAGPSDCWTGHPDERLLRSMDKRLTRINEERNALAAKAVEKATQFQLGLPGSAEEQKKDISLILDNFLDNRNVNSRLRQIRKWEKPQELENPESSFWLLIVEEILKM